MRINIIATAKAAKLSVLMCIKSQTMYHIL